MVFISNQVRAFGNLCGKTLEAELQAIIMAMQHVWAREFGNDTREFSLKETILQWSSFSINGVKMDFGVHNWVRDIHIWRKKFEEVIIQWAPRNSNRAVDALARNISTLTSSFVFHRYVPPNTVSFLRDDHIMTLAI